MIDDKALESRTRQWMAEDPDPETRRELEELLGRGDEATIHDRMAGALEFGTAGLRGEVAAGSNRMNRAVVIRTTAGLSDFLHANRSGPVVVGFDARHTSRRFADDTIGVLVAAGHDVLFFDTPVPTPLVAFAAKVRAAGAAIVITASHNPPRDNGYKVYDGNAAQIVPPVDAAIAEAIAAVGPAIEVPRLEGRLTTADALDFDAIYNEYRAEVDAVRTHRSGSAIVTVYTPIHGVGSATVERLMADAGHREFHVVPAQREPDGDFPTVGFPNPEEEGAMDLVMEMGDRVGASVVLANDPDADRLAVALPSVTGWRRLTGNDIGVLLADWILDHWEGEERPIVINSIVSSPMLGGVAGLHGARYEQTLTGFKWIVNAALALEEVGEGRFAFGYEEALGYTVGGVVRDKDGMSAALIFLDMVAALEEQGMTVGDYLADIQDRAGLWVSTQLSVTRPGTEGRAEITSAVTRLGENVPDVIGGQGVTSVTDFQVEADRRPRWLGETPLIALQLGDNGRVLVRPSGTEPKLKIYVDLTGKPGTENALTTQANRIASETSRIIGLSDA